jgi:hypothetical protein
MADLEEGAVWVDGIYQLETDDPVLGGAEGIDNLQAKQLASRTQYLREQVLERLTTEEAETLLAVKADWSPLDQVIVAGGLTPDHDLDTQLRDAINNLVKGQADKIVRVASTAAINLAAPGASIDGTAMVAGDTFLEKDHGTPSSRGIYVWNGAAVPATRDPGADTGAELFGGMIIRVKEGTVNADTNWQVTNDGPVTVGVTGPTFQKIGGAIEATETEKGIAEIATQAETDGGTDDARFVTPLKYKTGIKPLLNASGNAPIYACRAWVNFNGTGTVAIRASGNVSSVTDNNTGDYTVNFTTAMPDANYSVSGMARGNNTTDSAIIGQSSNSIFTTSAVQVITARAGTGGSTVMDASFASISVFR